MNAREDLGPDSSVYGTRIARHAAEARSRQLPPEVVDHAKLHILDTFAAVVSGADLEAGRAGQRYAESAFFLDVRDADSYAAGHVTGAKNIPLSDLQTSLSSLDPNQWIITYCT